MVEKKTCLYCRHIWIPKTDHPVRCPNPRCQKVDCIVDYIPEDNPPEKVSDVKSDIPNENISNTIVPIKEGIVEDI